MREDMEQRRDRLVEVVAVVDKGVALIVHDVITEMIDAAVDAATANELATVEEVVETVELLDQEAR